MGFLHFVPPLKDFHSLNTADTMNDVASNYWLVFCNAEEKFRRVKMLFKNTRYFTGDRKIQISFKISISL